MKSRLGRIRRQADVHNRAELATAGADFRARLGLGESKECKLAYFYPYGNYCQGSSEGR